MHKLVIDLNKCPEELRLGLAEVQAEYQHRFTRARGREIRFTKTGSRNGGLAARKGAGIATIEYARKIDAFRALGRLLGETGPAAESRDFAETAKFEMLGAMVDASRNGVLRPDAAKAFMRRLALMGVNVLMLYTEDTYEVPGEPFFGYLRGRYTQDEMRDMDRYADAFGIEMFPCIQALAHLEQILQWPAYSEFRDTDQVILAETNKTYALLEKMIRAACAPFRSKRIHLGMDEAHGIGTGRYKDLYGEKNRFDILNAHLARVRDICRGLGLKPMIWSDMYFRIGSKTHDYYDREAVIPKAIVARIPKDVQLVYWDYYHDEEEFYADFIDRHRALGSEPIMAGGVWTWNHFWAALLPAITVTNACMSACKRKKLSEVFMTMWGDDGNECDVFSALPALQFFCEHGYADKVDEKLLRANFRGSCDADYDDWFKASGINSFPTTNVFAANLGKWTLWQDPAIGLLDPQIDDPKGLSAHYARLAVALAKAAARTPSSRRLEFPARVASALAIKIMLRSKLAAAYKAGNRKRLDALMRGDLAKLRKAVGELWKCHRAMWLATYKPFGLEVIERRYGGLRTRLESLHMTIRDYIAGRTASIPELDAVPVKAFKGPMQSMSFSYSRAATPSCIKCARFA